MCGTMSVNITVSAPKRKAAGRTNLRPRKNSVYKYANFCTVYHFSCPSQPNPN